MGASSSGGIAVYGANVGRDLTIATNLVQQLPAVQGVASINQIPPAPTHFSGRNSELDELKAALPSSGIAISGFTGIGGVGKTALALRLAADLQPNWPDAGLYLDLRGVETEPWTALAALQYFIRAFEPLAEIPADLAGLRAAYLSVLHDKRAIVILDNARDEAQVAPLIPPSSCALIVTSRRELILDGVLLRRIDALKIEDAVSLLLDICPRIGDLSTKMAELVGRLPLALRLAASALATRVNLGPEKYVEMLTDSQNRLGLVDRAFPGGPRSIEASLYLSYDLLTSDQQSLWRQLAIFTGTFNEKAVVSVWRTEEADTNSVLSDLYEVSMVEFDSSRKLYRLHDLARDFAIARLHENPDEKLSAEIRYATYYLIQPDSGISFFKQSEVLKRYAHQEKPASQPHVVDLVAMVLNGNPDLHRHFFELQPHADWIPVLWDHGFFSQPPEIETTPDGKQLLPYWHAERFLLNNASLRPEFLVRHLQHLEEIDAPSGFRVNAAHALIHLVPDHIDLLKQAIPFILRWLETPDVSQSLVHVVMPLALAISRLDHESAFELMEVATKPMPSRTVVKLESMGGVPMNVEAVSILDQYHLREDPEAKELFANLRRLDFHRLVKMWEEQLVDALRLESDFRELEFSAVEALWLRSAIEDTGQDPFYHYKDVLLACWRDALESQGNEDVETIKPVVERLWNSESVLSKRLAVHLMRVFNGQFEARVLDLLLDPNLYEEYGIHHEFFLLLRDTFPQLSLESRQIVVRLIRSGPSEEYTRKLVEFRLAHGGGDPENMRLAIAQFWRRDRLWMLRDDLDPEDAQYLDDLSGLVGVPEHPEFTSFSTGVYFVQSVSPQQGEQLQRLAPAELVAYLENWQPESEFSVGPRQENWAGLAREVAEVIGADLGRYIDFLLPVAKASPSMATALLNISLKTTKKEKEEPLPEAMVETIEHPSLWEIKIGLIEGLLGDASVRTSVGYDPNGSWMEVRRLIASSFENALRYKDEQIKEGLLPRVRNLLLELCEDADPDAASDQPPTGWAGHRDPVTVAINHVRSQALIALVNYARNVADREPRKNGNNEQGNASSSIDTAVTATLDRHLEVFHDSSVAVRSVYGRYLWTLYSLDSSWVERHLNDIFPLSEEDEETLWYFTAAWDAWVIFNKTLTSHLFEKLRTHYAHAIELRARGYVTATHLQPVTSMVDHLLYEFFEYPYDLNAAVGERNLLGFFFATASANDRGTAIWRLWQHVAQTQTKADDALHSADFQETSPEFWPKVRTFWQWRANVISENFQPDEFEAERQWPIRFLDVAPENETLTSLRQLIFSTIANMPRNNSHPGALNTVERFLMTQVEADPVKTIDFYREVLAQLDGSPWRKLDDARKILETAAAHESARHTALELIDGLARKGIHAFDDIYARWDV